ncbi:hypothetical protein ACI3LZ_000661 [Candidozyma auris]
MSRPSTDTSYQESKSITFPDNSEDRVISDELQPQSPIDPVRLLMPNFSVAETRFLRLTEEISKPTSSLANRRNFIGDDGVKVPRIVFLARESLSNTIPLGVVRIRTYELILRRNLT